MGESGNGGDHATEQAIQQVRGYQQGKYKPGEYRGRRYPAEFFDTLRYCFNKMMSSYLIAEFVSRKYGIKISRNTVIGALNRMGLHRGRGERANLFRRPYSPRGGVPRVGNESETSRNLSVNVGISRDLTELPTDPEKPLPPMRLVSVLELKQTSCRWPVEPHAEFGWKFCGREEADITDKRAYCREHAAQAYPKR